MALQVPREQSALRALRVRQVLLVQPGLMALRVLREQSVLLALRVRQVLLVQPGLTARPELREPQGLKDRLDPRDLPAERGRPVR